MDLLLERCKSPAQLLKVQLHPPGSQYNPSKREPEMSENGDYLSVPILVMKLTKPVFHPELPNEGTLR